jgi:hypothetical protein
LNLSDHKKRIRRYLRDPENNIWTDTVLLHQLNDSQRYLHRRVGMLENVAVIKVPPDFDMSYLQEWEYAYLKDQTARNYKTLRYHDQSDTVFCNRWESEALAGIDSSTGDEGTHFTHPFEAWTITDTIGDIVPVWFPNDFNEVSTLFWDSEPVEFELPKNIKRDDMSWVSHTGKTMFYYPIDETDNCFALYPIPSTVSWDDITAPDDYTPNYVFFHDWEGDAAYLTETSYRVLQYHEETQTGYVYKWEGEHLDGGDCLISDKTGMRAQWPWEVSLSSVLTVANGIESFNWATADDDSDTWNTDSNATMGFDDNVLLVYKSRPVDLEEEADVSVFPRFLTKYFEQDALAKLYAMNTDGRIESLRDYWAFRRDTGIKLIEKYRVSRLADRDFCMQTKGVGVRRSLRHPRLPDEYPAI